MKKRLFILFIVFVFISGCEKKDNGIENLSAVNTLKKTEEKTVGIEDEKKIAAQVDGKQNNLQLNKKEIYLCVAEFYENDESRILTYDDYGNLTKKEYFEKDSEISYYTEEYSYDNQGRLINSRAIYDDGTVEDWVKNEYDSSGKLIKEYYYTTDGIIWQTAEHDYDNNGLCLQSKYFLDNGEISREIQNIYDSNLQLKEKVEFAYGMLESKTIYTNEDGVLKETILDGEGQLIQGTEFYYREGVLQSECIYDYSGEMYLRKVYYYDENGKLSTLRYHHGMGDDFKVFTYDYDDNGNMILEWEHDLNGVDYSPSKMTHFYYQLREVNIYEEDNAMGGNEESGENLVVEDKGQEIDATQGAVILSGKLEYRIGTNAAETMSKEMYILKIEPQITKLIYYNLEDEICIAENITEIDVSGLIDEGEKGLYDGKNVSIKGKIWPTVNSNWFNEFAISMEEMR